MGRVGRQKLHFLAECLGFLVSFHPACRVFVATFSLFFLPSAQLLVRYALTTYIQDKYCLNSLHVTPLNKVL